MGTGSLRGVVQMVQVPGFWIFLKTASRLVPDGWVEIKISGCRCDFWSFQLELDILRTKNIEIGSVDTKLQLFKVGRFFEKSGNPKAVSEKINGKSRKMSKKSSNIRHFSIQLSFLRELILLAQKEL